MRKVVFQAWCELIDQEVGHRLPGFSLFAGRSRGEPRNLRKYVWKPIEGLWCFIAFRPLESEAFDAYVGWSDKERFPGQDCIAPTQDAMQDLGAPCRIVQSLDLVPRSGLAHWNFWQAPPELLDDPQAFGAACAAHFSKELNLEQALDLVRPAVDKGISEVHDHGLPYLARKIQFASGR